MFRRFIGDRAFYRRVFGIAIPIIIQSGITNFVSMLDNIMVGQIGTVPMSGVSIVNGLLFVFNLCVFGGTAGAGIFTAQFHGSGDQEGVRYTFRFKLLLCLALGLIGIGIFLAGGTGLIGLYLKGDGDAAMAAETLEYGLNYLWVMLWGLIPFALSNAYSSTLRECGETIVPMVGGVAAVFINLLLNYVLIFGHFGAPAMGVEGAALATVISRFAELLIVAIWAHRNHPFTRGVFRSFSIPRELLKRITVKGLPLLGNEFLWSTGMAILNQCYSTRGLDVVPSMNISSTLVNLSSVIYMSIGNVVGILMGQMLGASLPEEKVRSANRKLIFLSVSSGLLLGGIMALFRNVFPMIYNTTDSVRELAGVFILIGGVMMPFHSFTHATYFTLRSGGQTFVTFLFDSFYAWVVNVPLAFCLSRFTSLPIIPLYLLCCCADLIKVAIGGRMLKQGKWIQNLTR